MIIPVYNADKFIRKCIASILCQSFSDFEIVLVDDGSQDDSASIIREYEEKYDIIKGVFKKNGGVSSARNEGIKVATGKYLVFVDADDEVKEDYLAQLYKYSQFDYVISGIINRYTNLKKIEDSKDLSSMLKDSKGEKINELPKEFFIRGFIHTCCGKLYKLEIVQKHNIRFPEVRLSEDSFFNIEYLKHIKKWKIVESANYIYIHRKSDENATAKWGKKDIDIYIRLHEEMLQLPVKKGYVDSTLYSQYLAICLKLLKQNLTQIEKKKQLEKIMRKRKVRQTLIFSATNKGEWLTGIIICLGDINLINKWLKFIELR